MFHIDTYCSTLSNGNCTSCVDHYYFNSNVDKCLECPSNCKSCEGSRCKQCDNGYGFDGPDCQKGNIVHCKVYNTIIECRVCEYGYGLNAFSQCSQCEDSNCLR